MRSTRLKRILPGVCLVLIFVLPYIAGADEYSQVLLKSTPPGAKIYIDNTFYGRTPLNFHMAEGEYWLELRKSGYELHQEKVIVRSRRFHRIDVELEKSGKYGKLDIDTTPSGAKLFIDGDYFEKTPAVVSLKAGKHNIRVEKKGFTTTHDEIRIVRKKKLRVNLELEPVERYGELIVKSRPAGARIFVGNQYVDLTPARIELKEGKYRIKVEKDDYHSAAKKVFVKRNQDVRASFDLKPIERYGSIGITSVPTGCKVFIDDVYFEKTPFKARLLAGRHEIRLKKKGWRTHTDKIKVRGGEAVQRKYRLKRKPIPPPPKGTLRIRSTPQEARVKIKGDDYGETPVDIKLSPGIYQVEIVKKGFKKYQERIELGIGEMKPIWVELEKIAPVIRYGKLKVTANKRAKVIIDGEYRGETPLIVRLAKGPHRLKVKRKHYRVFKEEVHVKAGREDRINVILVRKDSFEQVPRQGKIKIVSEPLSAKIFINNQYYGRTPETFKLSPGEYNLEIRHKGYHPYRQELRVGPGGNRPVRAHLRWKGRENPAWLIHEIIKDALDKN